MAVPFAVSGFILQEESGSVFKIFSTYCKALG